MIPKVVLLSIHPKYSDMIFNGSKSVELRRIRPKVMPGDLLVIYASTPKKSVVGIVTVEKVVEKHVHELWEEVKDLSGVSYDQFIYYFSGAATGCGIYLHQQFRYSQTCISLKELKDAWKGFHPPQSYRYLNHKEVNLFSRLFELDIRQISNVYQGALCSI